MEMQEQTWAKKEEKANYNPTKKIQGNKASK
jgi:hypothetical protein